MPVIAITGGVGAGKSTVALQFSDLGAVVFSADEIAREVLNPGSAVLEEVIREFGREYILPDGRLDRKKMGNLVFSDSSSRRRLEQITHPAIRQILQERVSRVLADQPDAVVVVEVPLLYESGMESGYDAVIAVIASKENTVQRLSKRDGLSAAEIEKRIAAQLPMQEKAMRANYVIQNDGKRDALKDLVRSIWDQFLSSGTESKKTVT
jgi:dephospho-CoA kinase